MGTWEKRDASWLGENGVKPEGNGMGSEMFIPPLPTLTKLELCAREQLGI